MARTLLNAAENVQSSTVTRALLNTATAGSAVIAKVIAGAGISLTSTGADAGTGDVTVAVGGGSALTKQLYFGQTTLTDAATIAWDVSVNQAAKVTLAGNRTMGAPTNLQAGATYILEVIQDATGSRTITWNAVFKWPGATAPTLSTAANARDLLTFFYDGTYMLGVGSLAFG